MKKDTQVFEQITIIVPKDQQENVSQYIKKIAQRSRAPTRINNDKKT